MAFGKAIFDFIKSIYELLISLVTTVFQVINSAVSHVLGFVAGLFHLVGDVVTGMVDVASSAGKFIANNAMFISIVALAGVGYFRFTAQGRQWIEILKLEANKTEVKQTEAKEAEVKEAEVKVAEAEETEVKETE